ncbi:MAG: hypothetical protein AABX70_08025 [Nanoarchaeota archaeon]
MPSYARESAVLEGVLPGTSQEAARALLTALTLGVLGEDSNWSGDSDQGLYGYALKVKLEHRLKRTFDAAAPEWYPFLYGLDHHHLIQGSSPHRRHGVEGQGNRQLIPTARGVAHALDLQRAVAQGYKESPLREHLQGLTLFSEARPLESSLERLANCLLDVELPSDYHISRGRTTAPVYDPKDFPELSGTALTPTRTCQEFVDTLLMTYFLLQLDRRQPRNWNQGKEALTNTLRAHHSSFSSIVRNDSELYTTLRAAKHKGYVAACRDGEVLSKIPDGFRGSVVLTPKGRRFALKVLAYTQVPFEKSPFYQWVSVASPVSLREPSLLGDGNQTQVMYTSVQNLIKNH